jgi:formate hydrogenlyase subunit 6/NADH:ubiquinone oxidoreductase subunit I
MTPNPPQSNEHFVLDVPQLNELLQCLARRGYQLLGPTVREGAIVYDRVASTKDLPGGWTDEQDGGKYRLKRRNDEALFGYVVGPHSWKKFLFPPAARLWRAERFENGFQIVPEEHAPQKYAFIGVRACELHAMAVQDKVFLGGQYADPLYKSRRESVFLVAVNCAQAGGTCFCVSMNTGPKASSGYDLALTEVLEGSRHYFVVHVGTDLGGKVLDEISPALAVEKDVLKADEIVAETARHMGRTMDTSGIKELLYRNLEHPRWENVAERCLTCANCTMVCPTCFCSTVEDTSDLAGDHAERWRRWDSCFTAEFSYIHGGNVRASAKSRYRQWMTHKLASWFDQFGSSGCVGCGRCITWCPVAIDITEEVRAIRESEPRGNTK